MSRKQFLSFKAYSTSHLLSFLTTVWGSYLSRNCFLKIFNEVINIVYCVDAHFYYCNQTVHSSLNHDTSVPSKLSSFLIWELMVIMNYLNNTFRFKIYIITQRRWHILAYKPKSKCLLMTFLNSFNWKLLWTEPFQMSSTYGGILSSIRVLQMPTKLKLNQIFISLENGRSIREASLAIKI